MYMFGSFDVNELRRLENDIDQMFERWAPSTGIRATRRGAFPPINVGFTPERVDVYVFAAGLDPKSLELTIQQNLLIVAGNRPAPAEASADYYRRERFDGEFRRVVTLPDDVDPDRVDASYRDGVVHVTVQRREASRPRQISVK
jgi:HSP20 family protein